MACNLTTNQKEGKQLQLYTDKQSNNKFSKNFTFKDMLFE